MIISNLLLIPGTGDTASEIFHALRYEKTVRLYAFSQGSERTPHRMTPLRQLPKISDEAFVAELTAAVEQAHIDYIVPTNAEARAFFKQYTDIAPILNTNMDSGLPPYPDAPSMVIDCYTDKNHTIIYGSARQRIVGKETGQDIWQSIDLTSEHEALLTENAKRFSLRGPWCLAVSESGKAEGILPYFTPEMSIHRARGVNFLLLQLHEARGNVIQALPVTAPAKFSKAKKAISLELNYQTVFLDLDDTLIIKGSVNDTAIAFIYRCQANNIPVHLITRHYRNPALTLCEFGIAEDLFESIIWIEDNKPKSYYMQGTKEVLFIDDAFSERKEVTITAPEIPSLPPESLEALMVTL